MRFDLILDQGLTKEHVSRMSEKLKINPENETDLFWIAYLYCLLLIRFSPNNNVKYLSFLLNKSISEKIEFDDFFLNLTKF